MTRALAGDVWHDLDDEAGQLCAGFEGFLTAGVDYRPSDLSCEALFAKFLEDSNQFVFGVGVDDIGGGLARGVIHAHVQWGFVRVCETALRLVELH